VSLEAERVRHREEVPPAKITTDGAGARSRSRWRTKAVMMLSTCHRIGSRRRCGAKWEDPAAGTARRANYDISRAISGRVHAGEGWTYTGSGQAAALEGSPPRDATTSWCAGSGTTALRVWWYPPAAHRKATCGHNAKSVPDDCPPTSDADTAPCPTCSRYSCRCDQADEPWTRLKPWSEAVSANA